MIVVAHWMGQPQAGGKSFEVEDKDQEIQTTSIEVQRAIKGGIEPGIYEVTVDSSFHGLFDGSGVISNGCGYFSVTHNSWIS